MSDLEFKSWLACVHIRRACVRMLSGFSCVWLFSTPWTLAHQAPLSMGFSRRQYWSGLPCPSPRDLPDSGAEPMSPALQVDSSSANPCGKPAHVRSYGSFRAKVVSGIKDPLDLPLVPFILSPLLQLCQLFGYCLVIRLCLGWWGTLWKGLWLFLRPAGIFFLKVIGPSSCL